MLNQELEKIGLTKKEAKVYLACLELSESTVWQIARKSGVKRTTVYDIIEILKDKGLISSIIKNKKAYYYAESPKKLENSLDEKKDILKNIMPELLSVANIMDKKPKIKYFQGTEGMKEVFRDTLNYPDQEILAWFPEKTTYAVSDEFFYEEYIPKRLEKKIWVRAMAPDTDAMVELAKGDEKELRQTRLLPKEKFISMVSIELYGKHKVLIVGYKENDAVLIENEQIYTVLKSIFEIMWESLE